MSSKGTESNPHPTDPTYPGDDDRLTELLRRGRAGDRVARDRSLELVIDRLKQIAGCVTKNDAGETLSATALVNEAYLRLFGGSSAEWADREHFFAVAALAMRSILVDHARKRARSIRPLENDPSTLDRVVASFEERATDLIELDSALSELAKFDSTMARLVELRFFAGLPVTEVAVVSGIPLRTVERNLELAKRWLAARLGKSD